MHPARSEAANCCKCSCWEQSLLPTIREGRAEAEHLILSWEQEPCPSHRTTAEREKEAAVQNHGLAFKGCVPLTPTTSVIHSPRTDTLQAKPHNNKTLPFPVFLPFSCSPQLALFPSSLFTSYKYLLTAVSPPQVTPGRAMPNTFFPSQSIPPSCRIAWRQLLGYTGVNDFSDRSALVGPRSSRQPV